MCGLDKWDLLKTPLNMVKFVLVCKKSEIIVPKPTNNTTTIYGEVGSCLLVSMQLLNHEITSLVCTIHFMLVSA